MEATSVHADASAGGGGSNGRTSTGGTSDGGKPDALPAPDACHDRRVVSQRPQQSDRKHTI